MRATDESATDTDEQSPDVQVSVHQSRPGRVVFTEDGNTDAWIATDLAVSPDR